MLAVTPPEREYIHNKVVRALCPHCGLASTLTLVALPNVAIVSRRRLAAVVAGYACDACNEPIPIVWPIVERTSEGCIAAGGVEVMRVREAFGFAHVPAPVRAAVEEALDCFSVRAYNGFAAMCRRAIQASCDTLGAAGSTRVEAQINELRELAALDDETFAAVRQIMLGGHDGAHPQLPPVDEGRAELLLRLLRDAMHQLFTRPGLIREAAAARTGAARRGAAS